MPTGTEVPTANSRDSECPDQFWRGSTSCLPADFSEADAASEREFYGEVKVRIVEKFDPTFGASLRRGDHPYVWKKSDKARARVEELSAWLEFFVELCRAPDIVVRALIQQASMLDKYQAELTQARPVPSLHPNPCGSGLRRGPSGLHPAGQASAASHDQ